MNWRISETFFVKDEKSGIYKISEDVEHLTILLKDLSSFGGDALEGTVSGLMTCVKGVNDFLKDHRDLVDSAASAIPILVAAYGAWFAATRLGKAEIVQLTGSLVLSNGAKREAIIPSSEVREVVKKELGDVLWYASELATQFALSFDEIADANVQKLASRKDRNVLHGSGDDR